jgi:hypothetical protein
MIVLVFYHCYYKVTKTCDLKQHGFISYSSGEQKSKMNLTWLKPSVAGYTHCGSSRKEFVSLSFLAVPQSLAHGLLPSSSGFCHCTSSSHSEDLQKSEILPPKYELLFLNKHSVTYQTPHKESSLWIHLVQIHGFEDNKPEP